MSKKKVVVIENHALATNTIRRDLMQAIVDQGYDLYVLTGKSEIFDDLGREGFNMVDTGVANQSAIDILSYLKSLRSLIKKIKPDVCLTFTIRPAIYGNLVTRFLGIDTISNITGIGPLFENNGFSYRMARFLYPHALKNTQKVFFQNFDDLNTFVEKKFIAKSRCERIPGSGVDYNKYAPIEASDKSDEFSFLFISRLLVDKGVLDYIEAAKLVKQKFPKVLFKVLGPLWTQNLKANSISQSQLDNWVAEGVIDYLGETKDVKPYIANADCVVLPSYREGTSNVLLESGSMAKPLIATNVTGCKEIIENKVTGYLCNVKDPQDLSDKMFKMISLTADERKKMGDLGRSKIKKEYDKKIVVNAYLRAIKELTN